MTLSSVTKLSASYIAQIDLPHSNNKPSPFVAFNGKCGEEEEHRNVMLNVDAWCEIEKWTTITIFCKE